MKCLKNAKTGNIIRVDDVKANQMAGREWQYVSKTEWKNTTRKTEPKVETGKEFAEKADKTITVNREETISEKQLKRKKK
jgi:hypothetical protein